MFWIEIDNSENKITLGRRFGGEFTLVRKNKGGYLYPGGNKQFIFRLTKGKSLDLLISLLYGSEKKEKF